MFKMTFAMMTLTVALVAATPRFEGPLPSGGPNDLTVYEGPLPSGGPNDLQVS